MNLLNGGSKLLSGGSSTGSTDFLIHYSIMTNHNVTGSAQPQQRTTELIPITEQDGKRAVNARDLHEFLECKTRFNDWIVRRIEEYDFIEGIDFVIVSKNQNEGFYSKMSKNNEVGFSQIYEKHQGGRPTIEYALTVNMAKELSMVEGNEQGKRARRYFIAREEQAIRLLEQEKKQLADKTAKQLLSAASQPQPVSQCAQMIANGIAQLVETALRQHGASILAPPPQHVSSEYMPKQVFNTLEASEYLKLSRSHIYKLVHRKEIPYYKSSGGKITYFNRSELDDWMLSSRVATNAEIEARAVTSIVLNSRVKSKVRGKNLFDNT